MTDDTIPETVAVPSFSGCSGATLHLAIDPTEHQRRQDRRAGPVLSPDVLETCLSLPHAEAVPWQALTTRQQNVVRHTPGHVFRITGSRREPVVTRLLLRPCRIVRAAVRSATACATVLGKVTSFAPMCERSLIITRRPRMETLIEFGFWGVGLYLDHSGELETLVEPEPWRPMRHTPAAWRFTEQAYASYLAHTHQIERTAR
ncbi:hypothetical protein [Streptomyces sp. NPDC017529]|uniref:hypothetical protein n=1 Tax=Streptomyces sp. NPDC017529 TaxID=3365000 RepID=UPI0037A5F9A8